MATSLRIVSHAKQDLSYFGHCKRANLERTIGGGVVVLVPAPDRSTLVPALATVDLVAACTHSTTLVRSNTFEPHQHTVRFGELSNARGAV